MDNQHHYLRALGIVPWEPRFEPASSSVEAAASHPPTDLSPPASCQRLNWDELAATVAQCTTCSLHQTRTQTVFGVGNRQAELMIIGEAPGFHEDQQGEPFVGRAGQLLTAMIQTMGFDRSQVYIANILKCRPPNNRDPQPLEVESCTPFLDQQIALVQPRLLLAVGRIASHYLLKNQSSLESLRQKIYAYSDKQVPLIVTYHPAYLLRNPIDKKKAYRDIQFVRKTLRELSHGSVSHPIRQAL